VNPRLAAAPRPPAVPLARFVNRPRRRADRAATVASLAADLRRRLPDHMVPERIVLLDAWPLAADGTADIAALPRPAADAAPAAAATATAGDDVALVADAFAGVLGRTVAPDDDFFRIGGHSLLAIRAIARLRETARVDLPIGVLWQYKTPRALGPWLDAARKLALSPRQRRATRLSEGATNLFLFPPALGFAAAYAKLADHLPGIALTAFGAPDGAAALDEDAASAAEIAPDGPLFLLGHSSGGQLAFLAARRLEAMGRTVAAIVVLDSYWATLPAHDTPEAEVRQNVERFVGRAGREEIAAVFAASEHFRESAVEQVVRYFRFLTDPALDRTTPVRAPVHLILAQGNWDRVEDWSPRSGGCTTYRGDGAHAFMVDHPHVARNAEIVAGILAAARGGR
jgi:thioesterase domain-containing protein